MGAGGRGGGARMSYSETLEVAGLRAKPGEVVRGHVPVGFYPDGTPVQLPLILVNGAKPGPVLMLSACMHALEVPGIEVIRRLTRELIDPRELRGAIIAAPVLNPWGMHQHSMVTPQDGYNLNRVFPGHPRSLTTHRLAHFINYDIAGAADCFLDFHANPLPALQFALVKQGLSAAAWEQSLKLAEAYGVTTIQMILDHEGHRFGSLIEAAANAGKPGLTIELVSWRRVEEEGVATGVRGALNVMKHLGMIGGEIEPQTVDYLPRVPMTRTEITANRGGLVHPLKTVGEQVRRDEVIALIRDMFGDVVEEVHSPRDGWILAWPWINSQAVATGDVLAFIAFEIR
jgi:predicted deacylase